MKEEDNPIKPPGFHFKKYIFTFLVPAFGYIYLSNVQFNMVHNLLRYNEIVRSSDGFAKLINEHIICLYLLLLPSFNKLALEKWEFSTEFCRN